MEEIKANAIHHHTLSQMNSSQRRLYNSTLDGLQTTASMGFRETEPEVPSFHDQPILRKEVEAAVQSLKKGKSAGTDNIPAELVQAGGEDLITVLTTIYKKLWQAKENGQPRGPSP